MKTFEAPQVQLSIVFARKHSTAESAKSFTTRLWVIAMNVFELSTVLEVTILWWCNYDTNQCCCWRRSSVSVSLDSAQSKLLGLALDAGRGLLYYTDMLRGIIGEMTVSGTNQRVIFRDGSKRPRAIVVDSDNRWRKSLLCIACKTLQLVMIIATAPSEASYAWPVWPSVNLLSSFLPHLSTLSLRWVHTKFISLVRMTGIWC